MGGGGDDRQNTIQNSNKGNSLEEVHAEQKKNSCTQNIWSFPFEPFVQNVHFQPSRQASHGQFQEFQTGKLG